MRGGSIIFRILPVFFIICCIWLKRFIRVLTSDTAAPFPLAILKRLSLVFFALAKRLTAPSV
jgi:hypothetical protein